MRPSREIMFRNVAMIFKCAVGDVRLCMRVCKDQRSDIYVINTSI